MPFADDTVAVSDMQAGEAMDASPWLVKKKKNQLNVDSLLLSNQKIEL